MKRSDKILLGLYHTWGQLDSKVTLDADEFAWTFNHDPKKWMNGDRRFKVEKGGRFENVRAVEKELIILQAKSFLEFERKNVLDESFTITLLPSGVLRGQKLSNSIGLIDLWYSDHKNGILGLVITILVSAITSFVVSLIT